MTLPPKDLAVVIKLLNLTTSNMDHEALSAVRKANIILKRNNINWDAVLDVDLFDHVPKQTRREPQESPKEARAKEIDKAFKEVLTYVTGGFRDFILDLQKQWKTRGTLSPKQYDALMKARQRY